LVRKVVPPQKREFDAMEADGKRMSIERTKIVVSLPVVTPFPGRW
jgi:hypothetical protein